MGDPGVGFSAENVALQVIVRAQAISALRVVDSLLPGLLPMYLNMSTRYIPSLVRLQHMSVFNTRGLRYLTQQHLDSTCGCRAQSVTKARQCGQQPHFQASSLKRRIAVKATEGEVTEAVAVAGDWLEAQKLDIRVGKVLSAELHPDADRYYLHLDTAFCSGTALL